MIVSIEYDDGKPLERKGYALDDMSTYCTPRGRAVGYYVRFPNGEERPIKIGFMKVSEMAGLES